ncbi:hypothetical protein RGR602_CH02158 [Rhizobium gallicum bv. gallicum R602sp]|uniref:Uncharacterized protein n=1 Tax=Rhizobium gallicum bv. gallicum R602sp TaxID=1041138 RepID=A0A0B4X2Y5_9HYPH|nr:hypothetical protein RGR602_CH02158 [Rhizobium gallicum bv. gallicum R602sp]
MNHGGLARIDLLGAGQAIQSLKIGSAQRFFGAYAGEDIGAERALVHLAHRLQKSTFSTPTVNKLETIKNNRRKCCIVWSFCGKCAKI